MNKNLEIEMDLVDSTKCQMIIFLLLLTNFEVVI